MTTNWGVARNVTGNENDALDRWVRSSLMHQYGNVAVERPPEEWVRLIEERSERRV